MSVAFPSGYNMERTSPISIDLNIESDDMSDGSTQSRVMGGVFEDIDYQVKYLERSEKVTLVDFWKANRAEQVTFTIDDIDYIGKIVSKIRMTMTGNRFNVSYTLRCAVV